jgi:hypothetical protein
MLYCCQKRRKKIRAITLGTDELNKTAQMELFFQENLAIRRLYQAVDYLNNRFGLEVIRQAHH